MSQIIISRKRTCIFTQTQMNTQHYDLNNLGNTQLVLDAWKNQATIIDNDVIPASKECPVIQGIENPATSLKKAGGQVFTTLPLYPLTKDVNFLFQNYINIGLDLSIGITPSGNWNTLAQDVVDMDYAIFFPSTACIPSRLQLLCGNSSIWNNNFNRVEARVTMASLPNAITDKSPDYFAINKLYRKQTFPGAYIHAIKTKKEAGSGNTNQDEITVNVHLNLNIDLNQLAPIFSNIPFVTHEMGELRLRIFFEDLERALCWCVVPNSASSSKRYNLTEVIPFGIPYSIAGSTAAQFTFKLKDWNTANDGVQIVQSCFAIKEESKLAIKQYIAQDNKITIPTQTWSTYNATQKPNSPVGEVNFQISAYNVNVLALLFPMCNSDVVFPNPLFKQLDVKFNSKTLNYIPYGPNDKRMFKDTIQALINDDCMGANTNIIESIAPGYLTSWSGDTHADVALETSLVADDNHLRKYHYRNPNSFMIAFGLSPVNCFEKGFNMASSNPGSTQVRVKYDVFQDRARMFANYGNDVYYGNYNACQSAAMLQPVSNPFCCCLCDCCLVLEYNPVVGRAQSGCIVYAEPTLT